MKLKIAVYANKDATKFKTRIVEGEIIKQKPYGLTFFLHEVVQEDFGDPWNYSISEYETGFNCRYGEDKVSVLKKFDKLVKDTPKEKFLEIINDCKTTYGIINKLP